jgi:hypothetical protein
MRSRHWRPALRRSMIGIAILAFVMVGGVIPLHRLGRADYHLARARALEEQATRGELMCMAPRSPESAYVQAVAELYGPEAGRAQERAFAHRRLAKAYQRPVYSPWLRDPIEPPDLNGK